MGLHFTDDNIRRKLSELENLFCVGMNFKTSEEKKRHLQVPITYETYQEFKKMSSQMPNWFNWSLKKKLKAVREVQKERSLINLMIFRMMEHNLTNYINALVNNYHLKGLCKFSGEIGKYSKDFRGGRLEEAKRLRKECKNLVAISKTEMVVENLEEHIRVYSDFFVQCHFRLDKFKERIGMILKEQREMDHKVITIPEEKSEKISLELPGWTITSKFE